MLPEVATYFETIHKVEQEYKEKYNAIYETKPKDVKSWHYSDYRDYEQAHSAYIAEYRKWDETHRPQLNLVTKERNERLQKARTVLQNTTKDSIARWMMQAIDDSYEGYVKDVLEILPATYEEIEELSVSKDWCSDFDEFVEQAVEDGVIQKPPADYDVSEIVDFVTYEAGGSSSIYRRKIQAMVNKIVEKALADQAAPLKQAS